jgi:GTP-binding protein EngB required for normal cell division
MSSRSKEKKVLLFGKTGEGKSTIGNMLVSGNLDAPKFPMGDGMAGVTSTATEERGRGYHVVDTVGLGEETESERKDATELIHQYLKKTKGAYSHIIFVKHAGRFDELDHEIWRTFLEVFKGAEPAFMVVLTSCSDPEKWYAANRGELHERYGSARRFAFVDFPPVHQNSRMEVINVDTRNDSLERLEKAINFAFTENFCQNFEPSYTRLDDLHLLRRAQAIWDILKDVIKILNKSIKKKLSWQRINCRSTDRTV